MKNIFQIKPSTLIPYGLLLFILSLVYLPASLIPFAHHDNVRYFSKVQENNSSINCTEDDQYIWLKSIGRRLPAEIECRINFRITKKISDLQVLKAINIIFIVFASFLLFKILKNSKLNDIDAFFTSIILLVLPGLQNAVMMANFVNTLTLVFVFTSFLFFRYREKSKLYLLACLVFIFISLQLYPAWAFIFPVILLFTYLPLEEKEIFNSVKSIMIGMSAFLLAAGLSAAIMFRLGARVNLPDTYSPDISLNIISRFYASGYSALIEGARLSFLSYGDFPFLLLFLICVQFILLLSKRVSLIIKIIWILGILLIFMISFLPWAIPKSPMHGLTRVTYPISFGLILIVIFGLLIFDIKNVKSKNSGLLKSSMLSMFVFVLILTVSKNIIQSSLSSNKENQYLLQKISEADFNKIRQIHIIRPNNGVLGFNGMPIKGDEFNSKTSAFPQDIVNFINLGFKELDLNMLAKTCNLSDSKGIFCSQIGEIAVTQGGINDPICGDLNLILIIDFTLLEKSIISNSKSSNFSSSYSCEIARVNVSSLIGLYSINGKNARVIEDNGTLTLLSENGSSSRLELTKNGYIKAIDWDVLGYILKERGTIFWTNGTAWSRE